MIKCKACQETMDPVNHNGRGLKCAYCWQPIPKDAEQLKPKKVATKKPAATKKKAAK